MPIDPPCACEVQGITGSGGGRRKRKVKQHVREQKEEGGKIGGLRVCMTSLCLSPQNSELGFVEEIIRACLQMKRRESEVWKK